MKVLGVDPGSITTGYGVVQKGKGGNNGELVRLCSGEVAMRPATALPERLLAVYNALNGVISEWRPDAVSVESLFFAKNVKSAVVLGHVRGVILMSAALNGVEVFEYAPKTIKIAVTGYGGADKGQMQKMVKTLLKTRDIAKTDASDALAAAICHIHHCREALPSDTPSAGSTRNKPATPQKTTI